MLTVVVVGSTPEIGPPPLRTGAEEEPSSPTSLRAEEGTVAVEAVFVLVSVVVVVLMSLKLAGLVGRSGVTAIALVVLTWGGSVTVAGVPAA
mmetsp:Transcript_137144/g.256076  ORF Transcript_137144/g.256076 Transcript_137144/m.256076 type:complete len:92 (-) Transcript_137144:101-376(-)